MASHAGLEGLTQQALLGKRHPCQIDGTALRQSQSSTGVHAKHAGQHDHLPATLQPMTSATGRARTGDLPDSTGHTGSRETGSAAGDLHARPACAVSSLHERTCQDGWVLVKPERKPLQELQPCQALSANAVMHPSTMHCDKPNYTFHLSGQHEGSNLCAPKDTPQQPPTASQQELQSSFPMHAHAGSRAERVISNDFQQADQSLVQQENAASPTLVRADSGLSIELKEAPTQCSEQQAAAHHQQPVDCIELFRVRMSTGLLEALPKKVGHMALSNLHHGQISLARSILYGRE